MSQTNGTVKGPLWLCGAAEPSPLGETKGWFTDSCTVDLFPLTVHLAFSLASFLTLAVLSCLSITKRVKHRYHLRYPCHVARWLLYILYVFVCLSMLGEGVLTTVRMPHDGSAAPFLRLYALPVAALIAAVSMMGYDHRMEYWDLPSMCYLKLVYWVCLFAAECTRLAAFEHDVHISSVHLRWIINKVLFCLAFVMCIMEIYLINKKVCKLFALHFKFFTTKIF